MMNKTKNLWIVTIVNSITETSMPVNEFVIYRAKNYNCRQTLISFKKNKNVKIPSNVEIITIEKKHKFIINTIKKIEKEANEKNLKTVYHFHQPKSALIFYLNIYPYIKNKNLFTVHSTFSERNLKYKILSFCCSLFAYHINAVSKTVYDNYSPVIKKIKQDAFLVIRNGVDFYRILSLFNSSVKNKKILVCVARIIPEKNHIFLLKLLKKLPDYKLILIGEIKDKSIAEFVKNENLQNRVKFTGLISRDEVFKTVNQCSVYVSASSVEGLPVSVLEAMSLGLIPVLSDIEPHREIKQYCDNANVLPFDENLWAEKIRQIGNMSDENYNKISDKIINDVKTNFSLEKMHEKYFDLYNKIIKD